MDGYDTEQFLMKVLAALSLYASAPIPKEELLDLVFNSTSWTPIKNSVENGLARVGRKALWHKWSAEMTLDFCGLDTTISLPNYMTVGVDVTVDPHSLNNKSMKLSSRKAAYEEACIEASVVLYIGAYREPSITPALLASFNKDVLLPLQQVAEEGKHGAVIVWNV